MLTSRRGSRRTAYACLLALALLSGAAWLLPRAFSGATARAADSVFVRRIPLTANDIIYDGVSKRIYASVPSSAGAGGNTITPVDPATGTVGTPVFVGSEPDRLAVSDDGKYLYTFLDGAMAVRRFDLTTQTAGLQFALKTSVSSVPYVPTDFAVLPGNHGSLAVSGNSTVAVYDDDVRRTTATSIYSNPYIEFGDTADTLYGVGSSGYSYLYKMSVASGGVTLASTTSISTSGDFRIANGRIYFSTGQVYDASTGALKGTFDLSGYYGSPVLPDPATGRVYFLLATGGINPAVTLRAYDINTFVLLGSVQIPVSNSSPTSLVRWGANGIAFRVRGYNSASDGYLYLVQTSLIPSADPVPTPTPTPSPTPSPTPQPSPVTFVRQLALPANDLVYDPNRQTLYASVPSVAADGVGNTVTTIDPATGGVGSSTFVGSEPNRMALTDDGQYLYVALDGAGAVRRFEPATSTAGLQFALGGTTYDGPYLARDIATLAGEPNLVAVTRAGAQNYYSASVAVYDGGVQRSTTATVGNYLEPSSQPSTLYASNSYSDYQKLTVSAGGVATSGSIYMGGTSGDFRVAGETLYTTYGKVADAATGTLKGTFPGVSSYYWAPLVMPDPDHGRVFYLISNSSGGAVLRAYDANTFLVIGEVSLPNITGVPAALVRWGADGLAFRTTGGSSSYDSTVTAAGQVYLIQSALVSGSTPAGPPPSPTPSPTPTPLPPVVDVDQLTLATNDLIYEPTRKLLYASVPSSAGANGNTITPLDPAAETVGTPVFVGSEPKRLALSDDAHYLYVALDGAGAVRRFDLTNNTAGLQFSLGNSQYYGAYKAYDLAALPGQPEAVAVSRVANTYGYGGVAVFDNDVQRPNVSNSSYSPTYIKFADSAADTLYSFYYPGSAANLVKTTIDSQGATHLSSTPTGGGGDFRIANGRIYSPTGQVIEAATGNLLGKFSGIPSGALVVPDAAAGRVYFLYSTDYYYGYSTVTLTLAAFDINTFRPLGSVQVPGVATAPTSLVRWGANGFAFRTGPNTYTGSGAPPGNQIFFVRTSLVPSNEVIPAKVKFTQTGYTVNEYGPSATVSVTRSGDNSTAVTVNYATSDGTAKAGSDYTATSGTLTFGVGEMTKTFSVPIINDNLYEGSETVNLTLSSPVGAALASPSTSTLTIYDDDSKPYISVGSAAITEPDTGTADMIFNFTLSNPSVENVSINYATANGTATAGSDYVATSGTLTIPAGSTTGTVTVKVNGDYTVEPDEYFYLILSNPVNGYQVYSQVIGTIRNNDAPGTLSFSSLSYTALEQNDILTVAVNRSGGMSDGVTVNYATSDGTAKAGQDYTAASGTLTFAGGETTKTFNITIKDDLLAEPDETFNLSMSGATGGATVGTPTAVITIRDNDPVPSLSIGDASVAEGGKGATTNAVFDVTLSAASGRAVTVNYATSDGTAKADSDYTATSGTLTFNPGETHKTINVQVVGDDANEPDETFFVNLAGATNATVSRAQGRGTILNDDAPTFQFGSAFYTVGEGDGQLVVTVKRTGDPAVAASVNYSTADGTASEMSDYTLTLGTLRFAAGETEKSFPVLLTDDAFAEPPETFLVSLSQPVGGILGTPATATVTINDNDPANAPNPVGEGFDAQFYVRQHYHDFLNREPDAAGLQFWTNEITSCGADTQCREVKKVNVSAAFFLSIEFQQTGYLVYRLNQAAYGTGQTLRWHSFLADTQEIGRGVQVGIDDWEAKLEANKQDFVNQFVARPEFVSAFQGKTNAQYVDALNANTFDPLTPGTGGALTQAERDQLVSDLDQSKRTHADVLRAVAENAEFSRRQFNDAFVLMQFYGYLRRNPNDPPDGNYDGYNYWLSKLNQFNGNFQQAEMVRAFIQSTEYKGRFGQ